MRISTLAALAAAPAIFVEQYCQAAAQCDVALIMAFCSGFVSVF
jgi:hypothetical protein